MTRRTKDQRDQDRPDLLAALDEAGRPLTLAEITTASSGIAYPKPGWFEAEQRALRDLHQLRRQGVVSEWLDRSRWLWVWSRGHESLDEAEDLADIERTVASWEPAP